MLSYLCKARFLAGECKEASAEGTLGTSVGVEQGAEGQSVV